MFNFDEKGKIFTNVVSKVSIPCVMQLPFQVVKGTVHVRHDERVKDELDHDDAFLAVTDAKIYDLQGKQLYQTDFVAVRKSQIIWLMPESDIKVDEE